MNYTLTGGDTQYPWMLSLKELTDRQGDQSLIDRHYQSVWPLLHSWAIPERWLKEDPGFPLLLRDGEMANKLPPWCLPPAVKNLNLSEGTLAYRLKVSSVPQRIQRTLILTNSMNNPSWEELELKFGLGPDARWCWTGRIEDKIRSWPASREINYVHLTFLQSISIPNLVIDLSYGERDTFNLLHQYLLINGALFQLEVPILNGQVIKSRSTIYGQWEIVKVCYNEALEGN